MWNGPKKTVTFRKQHKASGPYIPRRENERGEKKMIVRDWLLSHNPSMQIIIKHTHKVHKETNAILEYERPIVVYDGTVGQVPWRFAELSVGSVQAGKILKVNTIDE